MTSVNAADYRNACYGQAVNTSLAGQREMLTDFAMSVVYQIGRTHWIVESFLHCAGRKVIGEFHYLIEHKFVLLLSSLMPAVIGVESQLLLTAEAAR